MPYEVVAVTEMRVLVFVGDVSMLRVRECEGDANAGVCYEGSMVAVSAGMGVCQVLCHVVCSADDVLEMSVVECVKCVCVGLGVGWEVRGEKIGFGVYQSGETGRLGRVFGLRRCGVWKGGMLLCMCGL